MHDLDLEISLGPGRCACSTGIFLGIFLSRIFGYISSVCLSMSSVFIHTMVILVSGSVTLRYISGVMYLRSSALNVDLVGELVGYSSVTLCNLCKLLSTSNDSICKHFLYV